MPIKGQSKTTKMITCRLFHMNCSYGWKNLDRGWTGRIFALRSCSVEEINSSSSSWKPTSRKRRSDWLLVNQRPSSEKFPALSSLVWRQVEESRGRRRRKQEKIPVFYWFIWNILYLRTLQVHSGRSLIDPPLQDNAIIPDVFFKYIYHVGCAINLHSIINSGLIPGGQHLKQQTDSILSSCGSCGQKP